MTYFKLTTRNWINLGVIGILGILAIRFNGNPQIYLGLILAYIAIFLAGLFANRWVGAILGGLVIFLGYQVRMAFPIQPTLKADKLAAFLEKQESYHQFLNANIIWLIIAGVVLGFVAGRIAEILKEDKSDKFTANKLVYMAVMVALGVIINTMRIGEVSFGGFPIILSGYLLGPIPAFIVGGVTDLVAFIVRPSSFGFNPIFTLTSALTGLLPIVVTKLIGGKYPQFGFVRVLIGIFVGQMLTSVLIVPFFSMILYDRVFLEMATRAFIKQIVSIPIYAFFVQSLTDRLSKVIKFDKL